jgi:hypothetical protein
VAVILLKVASFTRSNNLPVDKTVLQAEHDSS